MAFCMLPLATAGTPRVQRVAPLAAVGGEYAVCEYEFEYE